jgi:hypothetical protein
MIDTEQIFQEIRSLPTDARRALVERIVRELESAPGDLAKHAAPPEDPFLGLLADEPELGDEIHSIAAKARHEGRQAFNDDENPFLIRTSGPRSSRRRIRSWLKGLAPIMRSRGVTPSP